ncbi:MAG: 23S rRNA (adenine(1618)-N(6))-methyltransferase RlmF [Saprospiraceae bacterium]
MPTDKNHRPETKAKLHPRNKHRGRYNFQKLIKTCPELATHVQVNKYNDKSINFFDPAAVKMLNKALLQHYYDINYWDIPAGYLCPPIPGRADYIHHIADLLGEKNKGKIPMGSPIKCLDIGVGANCVYPIIGRKEYGWSFVGSDIDPVAVASANKIIEANPILKDHVEVRLQNNPMNIFIGIVQPGERFDLTICNPPFHGSAEEAQAGTMRKLKNLKGKKINKPVLNFGGQNKELWCEGGELRFVQNMIKESQRFAEACSWFSTLISKEANLKGVYHSLEKVKAKEVRTIQMGQGNKKSRIVAWTFL